MSVQHIHSNLAELGRSRDTTLQSGAAWERVYQEGLKRAADIACAILALGLLWPLLLVIAVLIKLDSPGPALFVQKRIGQHGRKPVLRLNLVSQF